MKDDWIPAFLSVTVFYISAVTGTENLYKDFWWTYDGIAGPELWGLQWPICRQGKYQSPIDIKPDRLLFDPQLTGIIFTNDRKINGNLTNTGNDITLFIDDTLVPHLNATKGPLQYSYNLHQIKLHFGRDENTGSEHTINAHSFPAEIQILAYNSDLYSNFTQALSSPYGIAAFSIFLEIGDTANEAYSMIDEALQDIPSKGYPVFHFRPSNSEQDINLTDFHYSRPSNKISSKSSISGLPLNILLPNTPQYITYEGSLTQPGCQETVTWVIFNKPIYTTEKQLNRLRSINSGTDGEHLLLFGNIRPSMPVNNRLLRTNISYRPRTKACSMAKEVFYEVNTIKPRKAR